MTMSADRDSMKSSGTLADRIMMRLKNNPIFAGIVVFGLITSGIGAFWTSLPLSWRDWIVNNTSSPGHGPATDGPEIGWVFAGYVDKDNPKNWATDQRVELVRQSRAVDRPAIIRTGDIVRPIRLVPLVIADYRVHGTKNQLVPPWKIVEEIRKADDFTGRQYGNEDELEVRDVSVSQLPGHDFAVWLRVSPTKGILPDL